MIDWSKLKSYEKEKYRSFEELCYQIAKGLYGDQGRFTSIDDSGGGDGVEFYLTFPGGDQWGWQAKFYHPDGSLRVSSRKTSIKKSLQRACAEHQQLTKWFLCTPRNLTPQDQRWFDAKLAQTRVNGRQTVPTGRSIQLANWGESDFLDWMSQRRFAGKRMFFFGELELSLDWFRSQVQRQTASIRDRFNPQLHTETSVDARVHELLADEAFATLIAGRVEVVKGLLKDLAEAVHHLRGEGPREVDWADAKTVLIPASQVLQDTLQSAVVRLESASEVLNSQQLDRLAFFKWSALWGQIEKAHDAYKQAEATLDQSKVRYTGIGKASDRERALREVESIVQGPSWRAASLMDELNRVFEQFAHTSRSELHILGDAGVGKTHIVCHICHERLASGLPTLLILGNQFTDNRSLSEQLRGILDIPASYSWNDFLQAVAAAAEACHTRIPLVIDGLDGATCNGAFSKVWQLGLPGLATDVAETKDVVLVTTCRTTYREAIWPSGVPNNAVYAYGFDARDLESAIEKYFKWYNITADLTAAPLSQFEHPIYLRIFCETKNPLRQEERHVYLGEQTLFEVFDEYLKRCSRSVCDRLGLHPSAGVVSSALRGMAQYLWEHRTRSIPLLQLAHDVDGQPLNTLEWQSSRTKAVLDEGLLVCRDWRQDGEVVFLTYDLLGGYLIAEALLQQSKGDIEALVQSGELHSALFSDDFQELHPLHSDIGRCLAALLPSRTEKYLHDLSADAKALDLSIRALFEIAPTEVSQECTEFVANLFERPANRGPLLQLARATIAHVEHPLNVLFWSEQLKALPMPQRDVSWTEHVRKNTNRFEKDVERFEALCRSNAASCPSMTLERLRLLAELTMWVLTSTVRPLRDKATRALYWYGCRFPEHFLQLVVGSLEINDPYVPERMLAAAYGIAMARQHDWSDPSFAMTQLPVYGRSLYKAMFRPQAPHGTTHILARDYARRTIEVSLIHHPDLLREEERERIRPPFMDGGIRDWGESEDRDKDEYRAGNAPIQMDFANYTLGGLLRDRHNYDFEHEEYKRVLANIFWRIYELGYSLEVFGQIDTWIARSGTHYVRSSNGRKTDRYGKKYSWIAFYELVGFRLDQGLFAEWPGEHRIADADIDPSFPLTCQEYDLVQTGFLGDDSMQVEDWVLHGGVPELDSYLIVDELLGNRGPWVLLDAYIKQESVELSRSRFIFVRGFIVRCADATPIVERLEHPNHARGPLPDIPEDYYTYAGEIPWCDTYAPNGISELSFVENVRMEKDSEEQLVLLRGGKPISPDEENGLWRSVSDQVRSMGLVMEGAEAEELIRSTLKEMGMDVTKCIVPVEREVHDYERFQVLVPVRVNHWEDYHSAVNPGRSITTPAKELAESLGLCGQPQTFDLFEKDSKRASITFCYGEPWHTYQRLTYLRQDLLETYLADTNTELIWSVWGERAFYADEIGIQQAYAASHKPYERFKYPRAFGQVKQHQ